jgi:RNA polymerase sigma-70 factor, ECF subfamily
MAVTPVETSANWVQLARGIRSGDQARIADLYASLIAPLRACLARVVSPDDVDDSLHEVVVIVLGAIQREELRDPERLAGFVRTIAHRRTAAHIRSRMMQRRFVEQVDIVASREQSPEERVAGQERIEQLARVLRCLSARDREILERFYFREQKAEQICREMQLTGTQFRLFKSRAIARCFELTQTRMSPSPGVRGKHHFTRPLVMA